MRGPIVGGLVFVSLAAAAFACGSSNNNTSSSAADAGYDSGYVYTSPTNPTTTYDASASTYTTTYGGCSVFPLASPWNQDISATAVDTTMTTQLTTSFGTGDTIHLNFGTTNDGRGYVITTGAATTTAPLQLTVDGTTNAAQSDKVACPAGTDTSVTTCFPIPTTAKVSNDDSTVLFLDTTGTPSNCTVYEIAGASSRGNSLEPEEDVTFASKWPLNAATLKADQFRAASASGTSIFAGLLKREDITKGTVTHALRVTMPKNKIRNAFVHPATWSDATSTDATRFPMGTRLRLKAAYAETGFTGDALIIIRGLKKYGVILADQDQVGVDFSIDGEVNDTWNLKDPNTQIANVVTITDFEVVNTGTAIAATPNND